MQQRLYNCQSEPNKPLGSSGYCVGVRSYIPHYNSAPASTHEVIAIIAKCDELIISVIGAIAREYDQGFMGCLSSLESLAPSCYRKSITKLADYVISLKRARKVLLKPRKRRHVPESLQYVPMLLTLALTRSGLVKYVDEFEESAVQSDGRDHSIGSLLDDEEGLTDHAAQDDEDEDKR
jgi:hypothetical protein